MIEVPAARPGPAKPQRFVPPAAAVLSVGS